MGCSILLNKERVQACLLVYMVLLKWHNRISHHSLPEFMVRS